jgi:GNAT superfamily N-acetyltransferase
MRSWPASTGAGTSWPTCGAPWKPTDGRRYTQVADLMGVVTRPARRRRGYGTAMTWAAVSAAQGMGCRAFVLTATDMGYPVYVKMGFAPVCTLRTYEPSEASA